MKCWHLVRRSSTLKRPVEISQIERKGQTKCFTDCLNGLKFVARTPRETKTVRTISLGKKINRTIPINPTLARYTWKNPTYSPLEYTLGTIEVERNPIAPANWNALSTKSPQTSIILTGLPEYTHSLSKSSFLFFIYGGVSFNPGPSSCQDTTRKDSRD